MPKGVYKHKSLTEEHKKKIGLSLIGRKCSQKSIQSLIKRNKKFSPNKGRKFSEEHRLKISSSLKGRVSHMKGKKLSPETRITMAKAQIKRVKEGRHPWWKGGINKKNLKIRGSVKYRLWREAVFKRDNWTCQECGQKGGKLNAHHILSFAKFKRLRFKLSNGQTLCIDCHQKTGNFANKNK